MNDAIELSRMRDTDFTAAVDAQSGQRISTCYQCGNCTAGCPAGLSCSTCSQRCPNNIDVAGVMETLRHMARKEGIVTVPKVDKFWTSFLATVRKYGRTYEIGTMVLYMLRSMRVFTDVDLAPAALAKGKLGFKPHKTPEEGAEAVGRIFKRYQERANRQGVRA